MPRAKLSTILVCSMELKVARINFKGKNKNSKRYLIMPSTDLRNNNLCIHEQARTAMLNHTLSRPEA